MLNECVPIQINAFEIPKLVTLQMKVFIHQDQSPITLFFIDFLGSFLAFALYKY
jgi:maltodextrin utilization protein YvdJ